MFTYKSYFFCHSWPEITPSIVFFSISVFFFSNKVVFPHQYGFSFVFSCFYHRLVATCFVVDLLWWSVVSSTISFFVGFHVTSSNVKVQSNRVIRSNNVRQYAIDLVF